MSGGTSSRGVVVTGGGSGIGRAVAHEFAAGGDRVLVVGRGRAALDGTADGREDRIGTVVADLRDPRTPSLVATAARTTLGRVDVLVNNASTATFGPLVSADRRQALDQFETNLLAPMLLTEALVDDLAATGGTVVNISSAGSLGLRSWPNNAVYGATKAGMDFFTRSWAVELADRGIRVIGLAPGIVDTGGARNGMSDQEYARFLDAFRERIPSGRVATAPEIAWWVRQLASEAAAYANGTTIAVDGALSVT